MNIPSGKSLALACLALIAAPGIMAQTQKKLSDFGFTKGDSTTAIQKALDDETHPDILIVDKVAEGPWITNTPLQIPSNIEIIFEPGAEIQAKRDCFKGTGDILFNMNNKENIIVRSQDPAKRGVLKMWPEDYGDDTRYVKAEWRHSISIKSSKNIKIYDMNLLGSGGDGMYLGVSRIGFYPTDIHVKNVTCDHHYRQGLSVIAGINCLFENVEFLNTEGTDPQAGVDFEPNKEYEPITNFTLKNCRSYGNYGCGYLFCLPNGTIEAGPLEITLDGCTSDSDHSNAFAFTRQNGTGFDRPGYIIVKNCVFKNNASGISLNGPNGNGFSTIFDNVILENIAQETSLYPINVGFAPSATGTAGNLHFNNVVVKDSFDREPFNFINGGLYGGIVNLTGRITREYKGSPMYYDFPGKWEEENKPQKDVTVVPYLDVADMTFEPLTPSPAPAASFSPYYMRDTGQWQIYGKKNQLLDITVAFDKFTGRTTQASAPVSLVAPSGASVSLGTVPFQSSKTFKTTLKETGIYTLNVTATKLKSHVVKCNLPIYFHLKPTLQNFAECNGYAYFYVPEDTREFAIDFIGSAGESLDAILYDPDGMEVFNEKTIQRTARVAVPSKTVPTLKPGVWKLYTKGKEDMDFCLYGIPPFLGLDPELLLKEKK